MRRSALALIGSLAGIAYFACLAFAYSRMESPATVTLRALGYQVRIALFLPAMILAALANLANWIAFAPGKRAAALTAAILYGASIPLFSSLFPAPLAFALLALVDFLWFRPLRKRREPPSPEAEEDLSIELTDDPSLDLPDDLSQDPAEEAEALDGEDDLEADEDAEDDLAPPWEDEEDEEPEPERGSADGMGAFLGFFMVLAVAALTFIVAYGLMTGKLPFLP